MDFEKKTKIKKTMVVLSNTFWSEIISSIRFIMTIGMFLVKELVNALGGGGVFFFFGTNEEIHCEEKEPQRTPPS